MTSQRAMRAQVGRRGTYHAGQAPFKVVDVEVPHICGRLRRRGENEVVVARQVVTKDAGAEEVSNK